jgi:CDP-diacylglycerol--serine O-phosphatidyltransferase
MDNLENQKHGLGSLPLPKMIPNLVTILAMIAGLTSVQKAMMGDFETAILLLLIAGICDVLDGALARALKAQSEFGAQLDSLSDFLAFGVAPGLILYEWILADAGKLAWIAAVVFPIAAALRLARFNVMASNVADVPTWKKRFFTGVPTPAGAILCLFPIYVWFLLPESFNDYKWGTPLVALWAIIVAAMMVSRIPTFSIKYLKISPKMMVPAMAGVTLFLAALFITPWIVLPLVCMIYVASIPLIFRQYRKLEKEHQAEEENLSSLAFGIAPIDTTPHTEDD